MVKFFPSSVKFSLWPIILMYGQLYCLASNAMDLSAEKEKIRQEVMRDLKDQTLVDDITEIRFRREVLSKIDATEKTKSQNTVTPNEDLSKLPIAKNSKSQSAVTASIGLENSLGYEYKWKNSLHGFRIEFNWRESRLVNSMFNASAYGKHMFYRSAGTYYLFEPFDNGFRGMLGLRFNDINSTYTVSAGSSANVNGNRVTFSGQDHLNYRFSFPHVTPYVGIGFVGSINDYDGLTFFADMGATLGRYNSQADTNISKSLNVDVKQIENELTALKNEKFSKRYLWTAKIGLRYSY